MYQHVVVPLDGSKLAEEVLPHATAVAQRFGARLLLVQVVPLAGQLFTVGIMGSESMGTASPDVAALDAALEAEVESAGAYLQRVVTSLRDQGLQVDSEVRRGNAAEEIIAAARDHSADLIAISTRGRGGITRLFFGSVADRVMREAGTPVLLVAPRGSKDTS